MLNFPDRITSTSQLRTLAADLAKLCGQLTATIPAYCKNIAAGVPQTLTANNVDPKAAEVAAEEINRALREVRVRAEEMQSAAWRVISETDYAVELRKNGASK
jgi:hypothetical protein